VSLDGNLRVFSLTELFQMLGMQRKSGILTVDGPRDTISVGFLTGRVVSVESTSNPVEMRLGTLLVKAGRLSERGLAAALELQKKRPDRLGRLLLGQGVVRAEDLREAFRIQVHRIVFQAFGWTEGRFRFSPQSVIEHDPELLAPIPTESILLEAARTFDELPLAEQRIPSNELVFRRAPNALALRLVVGEENAGEGSVAVSKREAELWKWVDGRRTVGEIRERAFLPDLDVLKGISDLLDRNLIEEGHVRETPLAAPRVGRRFSAATAAMWIAVIALAAVAAYFVPRNPANVLLRPASENAPVARLFRASSLARILELARAVRVYYGTTGRYPRTLAEVVEGHVVDAPLLSDPYGRAYRYILRPEEGKFALFGRNASGQIDLDLSHQGTLAPAAEVRPTGAPPPASDRPPGVQVVR
jgi:Domain of unknown function (DUF4388)